jgi:drug/metabolite transporter (DMT)-like permease
MAYDLLYPFCAAFIWGTALVLIKESETPVIHGLGISLMAGVVFLLPPFLHSIFSFPAWRLEPKILWQIAAIGLGRYLLGTWLYCEGLKIGTVSVVSFIVGSKIIMVSLLSVMLGVEHLNAYSLAAVFLATVGFIFLFSNMPSPRVVEGRDFLKSMLYVFSATFCWSMADILVKNIKGCPSVVVTFGSLLFSLVMYVFLVIFLKKQKIINAISARGKRQFFLYGAYSLAIAYLFLNLSLAKLGIIKTNVIIAIWPLIASWVGYRRYGEVFLFSRVAGAILVLAGCIIAIVSS